MTVPLFRGASPGWKNGHRRTSLSSKGNTKSCTRAEQPHVPEQAGGRPAGRQLDRKGPGALGASCVPLGQRRSTVTQAALSRVSLADGGRRPFPSLSTGEIAAGLTRSALGSAVQDLELLASVKGHTDII